MDLIDRGALLKVLRDEYNDALMQDSRKQSGLVEAVAIVEEADAVNAEPVRPGHWILEAHKEKVNCRWNVTAKCSECGHDKGEIYAGFFPGVPDSIARSVIISNAEDVKLDNYCPECGAKMEGNHGEID